MPVERPRLLFTSPVFGYPAAGGPALRIESSVKALSQVADLDVVCRARFQALGGSESVRFYNKFARVFEFAPGKGKLADRLLSLFETRMRVHSRVAYAVLNAPFKAAHLGLERLLLHRDAEFLVEYARRHRIKTIWFGFGNISHDVIVKVRQLAPDIRIVCDSDSVWSRYVLRELDFTDDADRRQGIEAAGRQKEAEERSWSEICDAVTAVSAVDAEYYRSVSQNPSRIHIFANVIDLKNYGERPGPPLGFLKPCIYLAGTFGHPRSPMDHAARWVLEKVLPLVRETFPDVHFYLVGRESDRLWSHLSDQGITATGRVESVLPYLCNADVALVPLMYESGTRFKILEAGACGVPIVSTTLGAEGIPVKNEEHLLIADTPEEFATAIVRLLRERSFGQRMAARLRGLVEAEYSIDTLVQQGRTILQAVGCEL